MTLAAPAAQAATIVVNFDNLTAGQQVGTVNDLVFTNFEVGNGFGETSAPNFAFNSGAPAGFDYAPGFTSLSFSAGAFADSQVSVFSGLGGAGSLLGSVTITSALANPNAFTLWTVSFAGTGRSVAVGSALSSFGWDDVTIGTGAVPEPASWAMLIAGFGLVGAAARRRRAIAA
ncbi:PEPxxWA-CTERM sorting domain-containing protein [Sandarakinorhabdus sp.]|uniref:PEPxxWA-CTERM sorting domain-containing protein n=1 Tax=Sandarakinorhabdus sp. TaxID=1916663 RepID=UPI0038F5DA39